MDGDLGRVLGQDGIEKGHQRAGLAIRRERIEALDQLDKALCSERLAVRFGMKKGDMLWVNNHTIAHNRTAYTESSEAPRTMIRLWLEVGRDTGSASG